MASQYELKRLLLKRLFALWYSPNTVSDGPGGAT